MHILCGYIHHINEQEQMEVDAINTDLPLEPQGMIAEGDSVA